MANRLRVGQVVVSLTMRKERIQRGLIGTLFILLMMNSGYSSLAQPLNPSFEHYTTDNGLSSDYVTAILKDRRGFMWFGTNNGLNRFDGLQFRVFRRTETIRNGRRQEGGMLGNYVVTNGLTEDRAGFLWVATNRGLFRFHPIDETFQLIPIPPLTDSLADNDYVSPLRFAPDGFGWFSSKYKLYRLHPTTLRLTEYPLPTVIDNAYAEPFFDRDGRFWLIQAGSLYRFIPTTRQYRPYNGPPPSERGRQLEVQRLREYNGHLLAATWEGLLAYDPITDQFTPYIPVQWYVGDVLPDQTPDGKSFFWLGGGPTGLTAYLPADKQTISFRRTPDDPLSFNGHHVQTIYRDGQTGIVWMGTVHGLEKIDPKTITFSRKMLTLPPGAGGTRFVSTVRQDRRNDDRYWLTVRDNGLFVWNRRTGDLRQVPFKSAPARRDVFDLTQDAQGRLWLGVQAGVYRYDPSRNTWQFRDEFLPPTERRRHALSALLTDQNGQVWIGSSQGGLFRYDVKTDAFQAFTLRAGTRQPGISRIEEDPTGNLWMMTNEGLYCLNAARTRTKHVALHGSPTPIRPSDRLFSTFAVGRDGKLWVSGIGFLAQADTTGRVLKAYTLATGLQSDHIFNVSEDRRGHLWLATDNRLHELNPKTGRFTYYGKESGLIDPMVFMPCMITSNRQGEVFIGYQGGFNYVQPEQMRRNALPPPVALTDVLVNNRPQPATDSLTLHPGETSLTVKFVALGYSQPQKNRYLYQLVGFDRDWVTSDDRSATYTNLEPGTYTFRVKAANNDGIWNETGATMYLRVIPAYWQTGWFQLLCGALVVGILYAIYRNRERQRQRLEHIRERIAKDLHDDMGSTLSSIRMFSDVVQQQIAPVRPEAVPALERISRSATTLSESMQDIIWTIQTDHDTLADVVARMREFGLRMAESKGIAFVMQVPENVGFLKLSLEQRRNLHLIVKESINNAVKYADCTQLTVRLAVEGRTLRLLIQDNGRGFDPATVRRGNGLNNLRKRTEEMGGTFRLDSVPGRGTAIEVTTKLG